jgi:hypothetical protein
VGLVRWVKVAVLPGTRMVLSQAGFDGDFEARMMSWRKEILHVLI